MPGKRVMSGIRFQARIDCGEMGGAYIAGEDYLGPIAGLLGSGQ